MTYRGSLVVLCAVSIVLSFSVRADPTEDVSGYEYHGNLQHVAMQPWAPAQGHSQKQSDNDQKDEPAKIWYDSPQVKFLLVSQKIGINTGKCNRRVAGAIVGGDIDSVIGNKVSDQDNRAIAAIAASLISVAFGKEISRNMDKADALCINQVLERAPDDQPITWDDPATGTRYLVIPYETYRQDDGRYCRKYRAAVNAGSSTKYYGDTACRTKDGMWEKLTPP
jgi:surface antigen